MCRRTATAVRVADASVALSPGLAGDDDEDHDDDDDDEDDDDEVELPRSTADALRLGGLSGTACDDHERMRRTRVSAPASCCCCCCCCCCTRAYTAAASSHMPHTSIVGREPGA